MQRSPLLTASVPIADPTPLNVDVDPPAPAVILTIEQRISVYRRDLATLDNTLSSLQATRNRLQEELTAHLSNPGSSASTTQAITDLSSQIVRMDQNIDQFNESIMRKQRLLSNMEYNARQPIISPLATPDTPVPLASITDHVTSQQPAAPMRVNSPQILRALPIFSSDAKTPPTSLISAPHAFMARFEMVLASMDVPQTLWYRFLPLVCNQLHADWISHNLASPASDPSSVKPWDYIKVGFFKRFDNPHQTQINLSKLFNAKMLKDESVKDFSSRFQHLMRLANKDDSDLDFLQLFISRLPVKVQHSVQSEMYLAELHGLPALTLSKIMESAVAHDSLTSALLDTDKIQPTNKAPSTKCPIHPDSSHAASDCRLLRNKLADSKATCPIHPDADHNAAECKLLKRVMGKTVPASS
jgi:hypothetical protein